MFGRSLIAVAVTVYLLVLAWVAWPVRVPAGSSVSSADVELASTGVRDVTPQHLEGAPFRGVAVQVETPTLMENYLRCIDEVAGVGADTVSLVVSARQENGSSTRIFIDLRYAPTPEQLGQLIDRAKQKKLRVLLMPIVLLDNPRGTEWRGNMRPESWEEWFTSYRQVMAHWARIAQRHDVDIFSVGSELVSAESKQVEWTRTINLIRQTFSGRLTYSANWDHYTPVPFWNQLDLIGMNSYWKLGEDRNVTVDEIVNRWAAIKNQIVPFSQRVGKPLLFMEAGWCSLSNAAHEPWDYTQWHNPIDLDLQRKLYEGFFRAWYGDPNLGGFMMWEWHPLGGGPENRGYTPKDKPAETVLKAWLAKPWNAGEPDRVRAQARGDADKSNPQ